MGMLAGLAVIGGALGWSFTHPGVLAEYLAPVLVAARGPAPAASAGVGEGVLVVISLAVAAAGILAAWLVYVRRSLHGEAPVLERLLGHQFYIEDAYTKLVVAPIRALARGEAVFDRSVLDGAVIGLARAVGRAGSALRELQSGYLARYAMFMLIGALLMLVYWVWR